MKSLCLYTTNHNKPYLGRIYVECSSTEPLWIVCTRALTWVLHPGTDLREGLPEGLPEGSGAAAFNNFLHNTTESTTPMNMWYIAHVVGWYAGSLRFV